MKFAAQSLFTSALPNFDEQRSLWHNNIFWAIANLAPDARHEDVQTALVSYLSAVDRSDDDPVLFDFGYVEQRAVEKAVQYLNDDERFNLAMATVRSFEADVTGAKELSIYVTVNARRAELLDLLSRGLTAEQNGLVAARISSLIDRPASDEGAFYAGIVARSSGEHAKSFAGALLKDFETVKAARLARRNTRPKPRSEWERFDMYADQLQKLDYSMLKLSAYFPPKSFRDAATETSQELQDILTGSSESLLPNIGSMIAVFAELKAFAVSGRDRDIAQLMFQKILKMRRDSLSRNSWKIGEYLDGIAPIIDNVPGNEVAAIAPFLIDAIAATNRTQGGAGMSAVASQLNRDQLLMVSDMVLRRLAQLSSNEWNAIEQLNIGLAGVYRQIGADEQLFLATTQRTSSMVLPPCASIAELASRRHLRELVEILKWPTCSWTDRGLVVLRLAKLLNHDPLKLGAYEQNNDGTPLYVADFKKVLPWLASLGLPELPPAELLRRPRLPKR